MASSVSDFMATLVAAGFNGLIDDSLATRTVYSTDNSIYQVPPALVVVPMSAEDLACIAATNHALAAPLALVARGGGTGTNAQSLTSGVVVDTRRMMHRVLEVDVDAQTAVVEPGVVLGQLNAGLREHGLHFAPHVSTASRATIGGMVATDAAGKGSLVHGRTNHHVVNVDAVLSDGSALRCGRSTPADWAVQAQRSDRVGAIHREVARAVDGIDAASFPDLARGFTGYNLLGAQHDLSKVICGSEGTLALVGRVTVRLTPLAARQSLVVAAYRTFTAALRDAVALRSAPLQPSAIECLDERTMSLARNSPAFASLETMLPTGWSGGALLLVDYDQSAGVEQVRDALPNAADRQGFAVTRDAQVASDVWKVRADAVGLLGRAVNGRRSVPFVEDCAVPPDRLEAFVSEFRALLDGHGVEYGMFGHADVGCVHVRPALDLLDPAHERLVRTITNEVFALVESYGGVLWGEHGRGVRGEFSPLDAETTARMRRVKTAFDPGDLLNPGKLYRPLDVAEPLAAIDAVPLRVHRDREVGDAHRDAAASAFECNGNGICHHWGDDETMCPSYKVTLDPRWSPKGRADLLRAWAVDPDDDDLADEVGESLRACLSCGACTGRCPVQVDIPEMKSRFFEQHPDRNRRRRARTALLSRFERVAPLLQRTPRLSALTHHLLSRCGERVLGVVDVPKIPAGGLSDRLARLDVPLVRRAGDVGDATVVILSDVFTAVLDPEVLGAAIEVLRAVGERPAATPVVETRKLDHVTGRRRRFARAVSRTREVIEEISSSGVPVVTIEPAAALLGEHEFQTIDSSFPSDRIVPIGRFLAERRAQMPRVAGGMALQLFEHCTQSSLDTAAADADRSVLTAAGFDVTAVSSTCCGMAGVFGHEAEHAEMSRDVFDHSWRPALDHGVFVVRSAAGYSCRSQAHRYGNAALVHPLQAIARLFRPNLDEWL